ncbi:MAG: class I SAM-dependent methyltransferase, partial [Novosphingobium sp.]
MWLLDKLFRRMIRRGQLVVTDYDGKTYRYGDGSDSDGFGPLAIRLTDKGAAWHIASNPKTGAGEAYMDGRLVVEPPHDIRDFILFAIGSARQAGVSLAPHGPLRKAADRIAAKLDQLNYRARSSKNVAHHYELGRQFYELFLDEDRQYSMAYYKDPANSLEQAQIDKKALIAAKLHLPRDARHL